MDDRLRELMQELGNAINSSLSDSDSIAAAIGEIKHAGYDVVLVLEVTIGFNKREDGAEKPEEDVTPPLTSSQRRRRGDQPQGNVRWTSQDSKFLRALKIEPGSDERDRA